MFKKKTEQEEVQKTNVVDSIEDFFTGIRKKTKLAANIWLIVLLVMGLLLLIRPEAAMIVICRVIGAMILFYGIVQIIRFALTGFDSEPGLDLPAAFLGILFTIVGFYITKEPDILVNISAVVLAIFLLAYGLFGLVQIFRLPRTKNIHWWLQLAGVAIAVIVGCFFLFAPFESSRIAMQLSGIALIYAAVSGFFLALRAEQAIGEAGERVRAVAHEVEDEVSRWTGTDASGKEIIEMPEEVDFLDEEDEGEKPFPQI